LISPFVDGGHEVISLALKFKCVAHGLTILVQTLTSPANRGVESSKNGVDSSVGGVHSSQDAKCSSRTDILDQKMKFVAQWVTILTIRMISVAQRIHIVN
jgi:hypothetical protein